MPKPCVFCAIIAGTSPATIVWQWPDALAIVPLNPCTDTHILIIPKTHVRDFTEDDEVSAATARRASELARMLGGQWNEITSAGEDATQTVWHLHRHLVRRQAGDGLPLPWTPQHT